MAKKKHRVVWNDAHSEKVCKYCNIPAIKLPETCPKQPVEDHVIQDYLNNKIDYIDGSWVGVS